MTNRGGRRGGKRKKGANSPTNEEKCPKKLNVKDKEEENLPLQRIKEMAMNQGYGVQGMYPGLGAGLYPVSPFTPQGPSAIPVTSPQQSIRPPWVDELFHRIDRMDDKLSKLEKIETEVNTITRRIDTIDRELQAVRETTTNVEVATSYQDGRLTEMEKRMEKQSKKIEELNVKITEAGKAGCESEMNKLRESVLDVQSRSMRDNLVFIGISEESPEDCQKVLQDFISENLKIEKDIDCVRVHRMGAPRREEEGATRPRPIVAKFAHYKDRDLIRRKSFEHLKGTKFYVNEQFPKEIEDRRKLLYPVRRTAYQAGDKATLTVDRLYVNGQLYVPGKPVQSSKSDILRRVHRVDEMFRQRTPRVSTSTTGTD